MQMRVNIILLLDNIIDPRAHIYNTKSIGILIDNLLICTVFMGLQTDLHTHTHTYFKMLAHVFMMERQLFLMNRTFRVYVYVCVCTCISKYHIEN